MNCCPHDMHTLGRCINSAVAHCIDCCRAECGSSAPGSNDWNWKSFHYPKQKVTSASTGPASASIRSSSSQHIRIEHECESCDGTGLYRGFAECEKVAVVCSRCKGEGKAVFEQTFKTFLGKKKRKGVDRVFQCNPGVGIGVVQANHKTGEAAVKLEDFGGISYKDWAASKGFPQGSEMRRFVCPAWWYQSADSTKMPEWKECEWGQIFSDCKHFKDKSKCWERFDKEQAEKLSTQKTKEK